MNKKFKTAVSAAVCISMLISGCSSDESTRTPDITAAKPASATSFDTSAATEPAPATDPVSIAPVDLLPGGRGTMLELLDDSSLAITRLDRGSGAVSGEKGVWTVFVYMCGSDLESDQASATEDLEEMIEASADSSALRFIVETDGTAEWQNELCSNSEKQRFLIQDGDITEVYNGASTNMGLSSTLSDFLKWGVKEYPSEYMMLDLWDHGGGSITGVCFDEKNDYDALTLMEIDTALASVYNDMTDRFELIGCDACLMATVETANIFAPYARYMVASQNLESGYGWDYTAFADAVSGGAANGVDVGKKLCDAYYSSCTYSGEEYDATLSVIDLSKLDDFVRVFNGYAKELYEYASAESVTDIIRTGKNSINFGGNNRSEGYTNMVDVQDFMLLTADYISTAKAAVTALKNCVVYSKNGLGTYNAGGLCMYYPLSVQGSSELGTLKDICISPYYLSLVDLCAYGSSKNGNVDGFDFLGWLGSNSDYWSDSGFSDSGYSYWDGYDSGFLNSDIENSALEYEIPPYIDEEGYYGFKLTEDSLYDLDTVYCNIMMSLYDAEYDLDLMLDLGTDDYVDMDWYTGVCKDNFDGMWFVLPDGQPICTYLIESVYDDEVYNIYTAPIYLNDEYTNLKIKQTYTEDDMITEILGVWDGISENGSAARDLIQLEIGDVIEPCYPAYDAVTYEYVDDYYGDQYVYDGSPYLDMGFLPDGDYYYSFEIYDYYNNGLYPDFVLFGVEDGELYYYE